MPLGRAGHLPRVPVPIRGAKRSVSIEARNGLSVHKALQRFLQIVAFAEHRAQLVPRLCDGVACPPSLALIHGDVTFVVGSARQRGIVVVVVVVVGATGAVAQQMEPHSTRKDDLESPRWRG